MVWGSHQSNVVFHLLDVSLAKLLDRTCSNNEQIICSLEDTILAFSCEVGNCAIDHDPHCVLLFFFVLMVRESYRFLCHTSRDFLPQFQFV
jgi:hypothetical protein